MEALDAVAVVAHHLAGLADIAELFGKLQQTNPGADDLLHPGHWYPPIAEAERFATPTAPYRLGSRFRRAICRIKF